jgi:membrane protease YdiL (CAAX protease family)
MTVTTLSDVPPLTPAAFRVNVLSGWGIVHRVAELVVLFVGIPLAFWLGWMPLRWVWGVLGVSAVYVLVLVLADRSFDRGSLWRWSGLRREFPRMLILWMIACPLMAAFTFGVDRGWVPLDIDQPHTLFFSFPQRAPLMWAMVMALYPIFSVYPQELIYRVFFFHRYERMLGGRWPAIIGSALAFGWMHALFQNWIAVVLSGILGLILGITYARSRSTAAVWVEHALYGNAAFTVGVGWFFFTGSVQP